MDNNIHNAKHYEKGGENVHYENGKFVSVDGTQFEDYFEAEQHDLDVMLEEDSFSLIGFNTNGTKTFRGKRLVDHDTYSDEISYLCVRDTKQLSLIHMTTGLYSAVNDIGIWKRSYFTGTWYMFNRRVGTLDEIRNLISGWEM